MSHEVTERHHAEKQRQTRPVRAYVLSVARRQSLSYSIANGIAPANGMRSPSGHTPTYVRSSVSSHAFQSSLFAKIELT